MADVRNPNIEPNRTHLAAHTCDRCGKPRAPYGVAVPTEHADHYCWSDCRVRDAIDILDREFGHGEAQHNPAALEALALLREQVNG